jgi:hypothetical protein
MSDAPRDSSTNLRPVSQQKEVPSSSCQGISRVSGNSRGKKNQHSNYIIIHPVTLVISNIGAPGLTFGLFHLAALLWILKSALNR